jgi:transcriptional regulator with XRE-family HTH domain
VKAAQAPFCHGLDVNMLMLVSHNVRVNKNAGPNHLKAWREHRDMTQEQLAEKVGTSANMIHYLETGERGLSAKWLRRLAPALNTSPGHLLEHDPKDVPTDILDIWAAIDERDRKTAIRVLESFSKTGTGDR